MSERVYFSAECRHREGVMAYLRIILPSRLHDALKASPGQQLSYPPQPVWGLRKACVAVLCLAGFGVRGGQAKENATHEASSPRLCQLHVPAIGAPTDDQLEGVNSSYPEHLRLRREHPRASRSVRKRAGVWSALLLYCKIW